MVDITFDNTDLDNALAEDGVVHESVGGTDHNDSSRVSQGHSYSSPVISTSLYHWYPLDEDSGTTATDIWGGTDGEINGATVGQPGILSTSSYSFDGSNDYIDATTNTLPSDGSQAWTFCAWINVDTLSGNSVLWKYFGGFDWTILINLNGNQKFGYVNFDGSNVDGFTGATTLQSGQWYHIAATYDGAGNGEIYIDGSSDGTGTIQQDPLSEDNATSIGGNAAGDTAYTDGTIENIMIFDTNLSSSQIQTLYDIVATDGQLTTQGKLS